MSIVAIRCRIHNRGERRRPFHLFQISFDRGGKRARRDLTDANNEVVKGAWSYTPRPFAPGLYCHYCLNEGKQEALPVDEEDLHDLGLADPPLVFLPADQFHASALVTSLQERFGERVCAVHPLPAQPPSYADHSILAHLHPGLRQAITERFLPKGGKLYTFQAAAIQAARQGHDFVVTTPTATGKSLTYTIPIVDTLLRDRMATAIYISPLVALTEDQLESVSRLDSTGTDWLRRGERFSIHRMCRTLDTGAGKLTVARYDGQVNSGDRETIRERQPQYILTTPDMLHAAILAGAFNDRQWRYLLSGLRYVVVDELHTYRGMIGAAFANLLRRLQRLCRMQGATPQVLCASATMVDPIKTVEQLIGRTPVVIDGADGGAPQQGRQFVLWNGAAAGEASSIALSTQAKNVLLHLLNARVRTIAFARSISEINDIYRFVSAELREAGVSETLISPFMRELLPEEKRAIISDLKQGRLNGVISTNALSMGIDIGNLSSAVIIGFPGSIAQLWQQAGRAGRAGEGLIILVAASNPLDQFFVQHPDVLFDLRAEPVYCNPDNPYIVRGHLLRAAQEAPLDTSDIPAFGPSASEMVNALVTDGLLSRDTSNRLAITNAGLEQAKQPFRNLTFAIPVLTSDRRQIVEVDAARAQRALHFYAHYQHIDRYYRVTHCDLDWKRGRGEIQVQEIEHPEYTTTARTEQQLTILERQRQQTHEQYIAGFGAVRCLTSVVGYYKVPLFARGDPFQFQPLGRMAPQPIEYITQACWFTFDTSFLAGYTAEEQSAGLYSLAGALQLATAIEALCDPSDLEALGIVQHPDTGLPTIIIYDMAPGGVGISEAAFNKVAAMLCRAKQIMADCPYCSQHQESRGCPYCVTAQYGDEQTINRMVALEILQKLYA